MRIRKLPPETISAVRNPVNETIAIQETNSIIVSVTIAGRAYPRKIRMSRMIPPIR